LAGGGQLFELRRGFGGLFAVLQGDEAAAEVAYRKAVSGFVTVSMYEQAATVAIEAARYWHGRQVFGKALDFSRQAVDALDLQWWRMPLVSRMKLPRLFVEVFDLGVAVAYAAGDDDFLFRCMQFAKARWLNEVILLHDVSRYFPAFLRQGREKEQDAGLLKAQFMAAVAGFDAAWNAYAEDRDSGSEERLQQCESVLQQAYETLSVKSGGMRTVASLYGISDIQAGLLSGEVVLELFVQTSGVYVLLIGQRQVKPFFLPLSSDDLKVRVLSAYLALIQQGSRMDFKESLPYVSDEEFRDVFEFAGAVLYQDPVLHLQLLYDMLFKPLEADIGNASRLVICPHWVLHAVPFHALGFSVKEHDLLIRTKAMMHCPSASIWERLRGGQSEISSVREVSFLLFGVDRFALPYEGVNRTESGSSVIEEEAETLSAVLSAVAVLGRDVTKLRFIEALSDASVIHLSCHADIDSSFPLTESLLLADGVLTVAEILASEQFEQARPELVVLSACRSGMSRIDPGDTLTGIGNAFLARCNCQVLASLWPVDAEATAVLMEKLYEQHRKLVADRGKGDWAEALRLAQLGMLGVSGSSGMQTNQERFSHPFYWAGFYLMGGRGE